MLKSNGERINGSIFSDEMGINLVDCCSKEVWNPPRKKVKIEIPRRDVRLNCWGGISQNGATSLHIYKGTLTKDRYMEILEEHKDEMDDLFPDGFLFQHDNYSVHMSAEEEMKRQNFNMLNFPTYSPDLSPIENLWGALKTAVAKGNPKTGAKLGGGLYKHWEELTEVDNLETYFGNLRDRYNECIDKGGERIKH